MCVDSSLSLSLSLARLLSGFKGRKTKGQKREWEVYRWIYMYIYYILSLLLNTGWLGGFSACRPKDGRETLCVVRTDLYYKFFCFLRLLLLLLFPIFSSLNKNKKPSWQAREEYASHSLPCRRLMGIRSTELFLGLFESFTSAGSFNSVTVSVNGE